jgi:hypothetical protein
MRAKIPDRDQPISRAEFLKTLGRLAGLGFLGWIALAVGLKSAAPAPSGDRASETCRNEGWCRPCPIARDCGLPRAQSYRQNNAGLAGKGS